MLLLVGDYPWYNSKPPPREEEEEEEEEKEEEDEGPKGREELRA